MIFKHDETNLFSFINDYDSERLIQKVTNMIYKMNEILDFDVIDISKKYDIVQDISAVELDCLLSINLRKDNTGFDGVYNLEVPSIKNSVMVKDRTRFIQKQLRDTLYITDVKNSNIYTRILPDIDIEMVLSSRESEYLFDIKGQVSFRMLPLYIYFLGKDEENKFLSVDDDYISSKLPFYLDLDKDDLFKEMITSYSNNKYRKSLLMLDLLYKSSPLLQSKVSSISDLVYNAYLSLKSYNSNVKNKLGLDITNRRVRNVEEIIYSSLMKQFIEAITYDLEVRPKTRRSNVVRRIEVTKDLYDFIQIEQLTSPYANLGGKSKISLTGPGSFNRDNVPLRLKLLHNTLFGNVDPVVTPDRDGTGVILYLASNAKLNEYGEFLELDNLTPIDDNTKKWQTKENFLPVCPHLLVNVPFIEFNDQARLQMSAAQCRQAVPLVNPDIPMVQTGFESSDIFSPDIYKSKQDGIVVYKSTKVVLLKYADSTYDLIRVFYDYTITVNDGDKVKKDQVIAYKTGYFKDGILSQGKNVLVAILSHPDTYEDAIILSEDIVNNHIFDSYNYGIIEKHLTTDEILIPIDEVSYNKILPNVGDIIKKNSPLLRIKKYTKSNFKLLKPSSDITLNKDAEILQVDIIPYKYNDLVREFSVKMKEYQYNAIELSEYIDKLGFPEEIKYKLKSIHNLYDFNQPIYDNNKNPIGVFVRIIYRTIEVPEVGDKFSNRYANKGVVSRILPVEYMPELPDGRRAQVIINPMSIISRMNIGQLYELAVSNCIYELRTQIQNATDLDSIKNTILSFYDISDKTKTKWIYNQVKTYLDSVNDIDTLKQNLDKFVFIAPPFESIKKSDIFKLMEFMNVKDKYKVKYRGTTVDCNIGYMYFYRLIHIASHKISGRSIGKFNSKTHQPIGGRKKGGGQRVGEFETWSLISYNALENLKEIIGLKSDDMVSKLSYIYKTIYGISNNIKQESTESLRLLQAYLSILGVTLKV